MYCRSMDSFHLSGGQLSAVGSSCISDHQDALGVMCMWDLTSALVAWPVAPFGSVGIKISG